MSKGHVFLAQNSDVDYIRQAYALALSIKIHNKEHNQTCLITNNVVPEEYKNVFDYIIPIPWKDSAENSQWKIENRWKIIYATPFDENLVYDADMLLPSSNDHWWKHLEEKDFAFTTNVYDYRGNVVTDNSYRKTFVENDLPNIYTGVFYFKKVKNTYEFFERLGIVVGNWKHFYKIYTPNSKQTFCSLDVSAALVCKTMETDKDITPILTFVHMKPKLQGWTNVPSKWMYSLNVTLTDDLKLFVGNYIQYNIFHYVEDEFLTDDIIKKLETAYEKKV